MITDIFLDIATHDINTINFNEGYCSNQILSEMVKLSVSLSKLEI